MPLFGRSMIASGSRSRTASLSRYFSIEPLSFDVGGISNASSTIERANSGERGSTPNGSASASTFGP
jgi:hypothetical protein